MYPRVLPQKLKGSLAKSRTQAGFTQRQVEQSLGLRHLQIYDYESGRLKLPVDIAVDLANLYQCSIETLLGIEAKEAPRPLRQLYPLLNVGLLDENNLEGALAIFQDPVIQAETGFYELGKIKTPIRAIVEKLPERKRRTIIIELLKYVNSLIGIDGKLSPAETLFRDNLKAAFAIELLPAERKAITKAVTEPYLPKQGTADFNSKALQHLLIWILLLCTYSDDQRTFDRERVYAKQVASGLGMSYNDFDFIEKKVRSLRQMEDSK